jgi:4-hydroxybenzoate polyprenyltransferase
MQDWWWVLAGATLSYTGGMFLNDAFDAEFDRQYRAERPIPSGRINQSSVWRCGLWLLGLGGACFIVAGRLSGSLGILLLVTILCYDAFHKQISWAPLLMGLCRFLVYLVASAVGVHGVTGWAIWCGLALAVYIIGLSYVARGEAIITPLRYWPVLLMAVPILLAMVMNAEEFREPAMLLSAVLGLWILRSIRHTFWTSPPRIGFTVSQLLAGIVFVDWLAIADASRQTSIVFIGLFLLALLFQRVVPAT